MSEQMRLSFSFTKVIVPDGLLPSVQTLIGNWWAEQAARAANLKSDAVLPLQDKSSEKRHEVNEAANLHTLIKPSPAAANPEVDAALTLSHMAPVEPLPLLLLDKSTQPKSDEVNEAAQTLSLLAPNRPTIVKPSHATAADEVDDGDESDVSKRKRKASSHVTVAVTKKRSTRSFLNAVDEAEYRLDPKNLHHTELHALLIAAKVGFGEDTASKGRWKQLAQSVGYNKFSVVGLTNNSKVPTMNVGRFFPYLIAVRVRILSISVEETHYRLHPNFFSPSSDE